MLDIRAVAYIAPVSEVDFAPVPLTVRLVNFADETGLVSAGFRIYNDSTGLLIYQSAIIPVELAKGATVDVSALTDFMPPAPADDTYFVLFDGTATNALVPDGIAIHLGSMYFDVKPAPLGPIPAGHAVTHEDTGIDEVDVTGLSGLLADPQTPILHSGTHALPSPDVVYADFLATVENFTYWRLSPNGTGGVKWNADVEQHHTNHEEGGADELEAADLTTAEMDDTLVLAPDGAGGVEFRAEAGGGGGTGLSETPQVLTDQAAIDWDLSLGGAATITLGGDRTLNEASHKVNGAHSSLRIIQDGTGTRLLTWHATYRFPGGVEPALSAAVNNIDILLFVSNGTYMDCVGMVSAVA